MDEPRSAGRPMGHVPRIAGESRRPRRMHAPFSLEGLQRDSHQPWRVTGRRARADWRQLLAVRVSGKGKEGRKEAQLASRNEGAEVPRISVSDGTILPRETGAGQPRHGRGDNTRWSPRRAMPPRRTDREDACAAVRIGSGAPGRERTTGKIRRGERPTSAASGTAVLRAFRRVQSSGPARPKSAQGNTAVSSTLAVHRRLSRGSPRGAARREARLACSVCQRAGVRSGGGAPLRGMRTAEPLRRRRASGPGMPRRAPQAMAATACDPPRSTALGARDSRAHGLRAHALRSARSRPPRSKPYVSLFGDRPPLWRTPRRALCVSGVSRCPSGLRPGRRLGTPGPRSDPTPAFC